MNIFQTFTHNSTNPSQDRFISHPTLSIELNEFDLATHSVHPRPEPISEKVFPILHFSQQIEPYALLLYINDNFQTKVFLPDLVGLYTEYDGSGGFSIKPLEGFTAIYPRNKDRSRKGPIIARGNASFRELTVDVNAGAYFSPPSPYQPSPYTPWGEPPYPRGTVEFWAVWLFALQLDPGKFSFAIDSNPTYELLVRTGEVGSFSENVSSEIQGQVFVSNFVGSSSPRPVTFYVQQPNSIISNRFSGTNATKLEAHAERALDWKKTLTRPPWPPQTATLSSHSTQNLFPLEQPVYSFQGVGSNHRYGITYINYIRVNNGNGSAFAYLKTAPKLLF